MRKAKDAATAGEKVPRVLKEVEADVVCAEHASQQLVAHRERAEDLGARKGRMHEQTHGSDVPPREVHWHEQQREVVHPHKLALVEVLHHRRGEFLVRVAVGFPAV